MEEATAYRAQPARPEEVEELQREWLSKAKRNKARDLLEYARIQGEKLHDSQLKTMEREIAQVLANPEAESELKARYHWGAMHRADASPVYAALKGFLVTSGPARERVEEIALEYLCEEKRYLERAAGESGERRDNIIGQAKREREKGILALEKSKANQLKGKTTVTRKPPGKTRWTPVTVRRLQRVAQDFRDSVTQWVREGAQVDASEPTEAPEPQIRFDAETLMKFVQHDLKEAKAIPEELRVLLMGTEGDEIIATTTGEIIERERRAALERSWQNVKSTGETILWLLKGRQGGEQLARLKDAETAVATGAADAIEDDLERHDTLRIGRRYARANVERLSEQVKGHTKLKLKIRVTLEGQEGDEARLEAIAKGEEERRREETRIEDEAGLTNAERVERRSSWTYEGPKLGWNLAQLQEAWRMAEGQGRMPREWYREAQDVATNELDQALIQEGRAVFELELCQERVRQSITANHTPGTKSTRRKEARAASEVLEQAIATTDAAFRNAGVTEPPARIRPGVEQMEGGEEQDVSKPQMALALTGVTVMEPRPRFSRRPTGRRQSRRVTPEIRMPQLL